MPCSWNLPGNLDRAEQLVRQAAADGAQVILLQELFATPYFCIEQATATRPWPSLPRQPAAAALRRPGRRAGRGAAAELVRARRQCLLQLADRGRCRRHAAGVYRKTHIPNAIGYQEKEYFSPGDTGFKVWDTAFGRLGIGICWDQWFPRPPAAWR
jgi:N-carbamoylputrescine amidase